MFKTGTCEISLASLEISRNKLFMHSALYLYVAYVRESKANLKSLSVKNLAFQTATSRLFRQPQLNTRTENTTTIIITLTIWQAEKYMQILT